MQFKFPKRLARWLVIIVVVLLCLLYLVIPAAFGVAATIPQHKTVSAPPEGFQEVTLTTSDGVVLAAWYAEPRNGAVIILLHGAGGTRDGIRSYAVMLQENGYGVLALDMRGSGESQGKTNRFGWKGSQDVGAAIAFLQERDEVEAIGGLGVSLGGEVLLGAASEYPALQAVISDGATFRCVEEYKALPINRSLYRNFTTRVMYFSVGVLSGDKPPTPLLESIVAAEETAFLFIAAGEDSTEVEFNELFAEKTGERANLWVIPDVGHTGGFKHDPVTYAQRMMEFFDANLLTAAS